MIHPEGDFILDWHFPNDHGHTRPPFWADEHPRLHSLRFRRKNN
ncbi:hypothetical protein RMSM_06130 [Rhodopirellula maiorica SM1]|uniref:Uncharacterized protein n=1 Tax=Rhodopirellula maiorica SM1 TaxID=1265738 RepID=M5RD11_9BACT|nr:hypothetical protein RMSM_06130 [Rhodopirellula maiorica SM1]